MLPGEDIGLATSIEKLPVNSPQNGMLFLNRLYVPITFEAVQDKAIKVICVEIQINA